MSSNPTPNEYEDTSVKPTQPARAKTAAAFEQKKSDLKSSRYSSRQHAPSVGFAFPDCTDTRAAEIRDEIGERVLGDEDNAVEVLKNGTKFAFSATTEHTGS